MVSPPSALQCSSFAVAALFPWHFACHPHDQFVGTAAALYALPHLLCLFSKVLYKHHIPTTQ
jgi:hypothetical protein